VAGTARRVHLAGRGDSQPVAPEAGAATSTFDNTAGLNNVTLGTISAVGVNGAFASKAVFAAGFQAASRGLDQTCQKASREYTASADQMMRKPAARAPPKASP
jgi:hypothetical protein